MRPLGVLSAGSAGNAADRSRHIGLVDAHDEPLAHGRARIRVVVRRCRALLIHHEPFVPPPRLRQPAATALTRARTLDTGYSSQYPRAAHTLANGAGPPPCLRAWHVRGAAVPRMLHVVRGYVEAAVAPRRVPSQQHVAAGGALQGYSRSAMRPQCSMAWRAAALVSYSRMQRTTSR